MVPTNPLPRCVDDLVPHILPCLLCELDHRLQDLDALALAVQVSQQDLLICGACGVNRPGLLNFVASLAYEHPLHHDDREASTSDGCELTGLLVLRC